MARFWRSRFPIALKIGLSAAVLSGATVLTFIIASSFIVFDNMLEAADYLLRERYDEILEEWEQEADPVSRQLVRTKETEVQLDGELTRIVLLRHDAGDSLWINPDYDIGLDEGEAYSTRGSADTIWQLDSPWRIFGRRNADTGQTIVVGMDIYEVRREVLRMVSTYLTAFPFALLITGVGGWWIGSRSVSPLKRMALGMERIAAGDFTERLQLEQAGDELDRLVDEFNGMARRLQTSFEQATRFTSDASHELRTPITVLRGQLENQIQTATGERAMQIADALDQTDRLRSIIDGLLLLSRSDSGRLKLDLKPLDLSTLVDEIIQDFTPALEDSGIHLKQDLQPEVWVKGDVRLLRQAIYNLISNARKYNLPENGEITVRVLKGESEARVEVENPGPLIDAEDSRKIFRRFYRAQPERESPDVPGTGLGLSIVEAAIEAHEGRVYFQQIEHRNRFIIALASHS